jgi:hypothetical protein
VSVDALAAAAVAPGTVALTVAMPMGVWLAASTTRPRISPLVWAAAGESATRAMSVASATERAVAVKGAPDRDERNRGSLVRDGA